MEERRKYTRIIYSTDATLENEGEVWHCQLIDLCINGALVDKPIDWNIGKNERVIMSFVLPESTTELRMDCRVVHEAGYHLGLHCDQIDIASATQLKRIIEQNVGNDELLNRELEMLAHPEG